VASCSWYSSASFAFSFAISSLSSNCVESSFNFDSKSVRGEKEMSEQHKERCELVSSERERVRVTGERVCACVSIYCCVYNSVCCVCVCVIERERESE